MQKERKGREENGEGITFNKYIKGREEITFNNGISIQGIGNRCIMYF